jgi:hypothetical protein
VSHKEKKEEETGRALKEGKKKQEKGKENRTDSVQHNGQWIETASE